MISYAITDPSTLTFANLSSDLERIFKKADMILYRDKTNPNYPNDAREFIDEAKRYGFEKILLHANPKLAVNLGADGVHLRGDQFDEILSAKQKSLFVVASCHTINDARSAERLGADMITYSPIFLSPNKGKPLGLGAIKELKGIISIPIIALGGILTQEQIDACKKAGASGFASIRFFK